MKSFKVSACVLLVVGLAQSAPQRGDTSSVVRTVTTQLQPLISEAVAKALAGLRSTSTSSSVSSFGASSGFGGSSRNVASNTVTAGRGLTEEEEREYHAKLNANAAYEYGYKVADDETQAYIAHEESRDGANVQGKYNYIDATGALVTVTYTAGPDGYNEERQVEKNAVEFRSENIPGPWTGPLAGVSEVAVAAKAAPKPAVRAPVRAVVAAPAPAVDQSAIIRQILAALQPQITSAVNSAISSSSARTVSRTVPARAPARQTATGIAQFAGDNSVSISTPDFQIEY